MEFLLRLALYVGEGVKKTMINGPRMFPPSGFEIKTIRKKSNFKLQCRCINELLSLEVNSTTTVDEFLQMTCDKAVLTDITRWGLYYSNEARESIVGTYYIADIVSQLGNPVSRDETNTNNVAALPGKSLIFKKRIVKDPKENT